MADLLADSLNKIKVYEHIGKSSCTLESTKLIKSVIETLKQYNYVVSAEEHKSEKFNVLEVTLAKKINNIGAIKPRHAVRIDEYQKYEARYIPSKNFGIIIVSTPKGVMSNRQAKEQHLGGRLLAFVY
ncbi:MAG: 30S ribosomal protein S8 [Candidatus Micrarchaeaceae archaeon]